mgnify:FL=1
MGLFDKKYCDICGEKIGLFGNRKLEDGNLCKTCAGKLSPFFSERRRSTVEDIKRQLAYRAENEKQLASFSPTITFDGSQKVHIDPLGELFIVSGLSNWRSGNPDLIRLSQVCAVDTDIRENKEEIFCKDAEGNEKSYSPPRYSCDYEFNVTIHVDTPWFNEIELELSDGNRPESRYTDLYREYERKMHELADILMRRDSRYFMHDGDGTMQQIPAEENIPAAPTAAPAAAASAANAAAGDAWQCPACGAENSGKFCANCGAVKPAARIGCASCGWTPAPGQSVSKFCPECGKPLA